MLSFLKIVAVILVTAVGLAVFTSYEATSAGPGKTRYDARLRLAGFPVTSVGHQAKGVLAIGQVATGVMVIAQGGIGIVTFAQGGVGLLFGLGQGTAGLLSICQIGIGLLFFFGQIGAGTFCLGQLVAGYAGAGQAAGTRHGGSWLQELSDEANQVLRLRRQRTALRRAYLGPVGG